MPALNAASSIGRQLEALSRQTFSGRWEVIVVDNGSTDGTARAARSWADRLPQLRVVDAPERQAHTFARNTGARAASGEWLLYCDADDVVEPGWVAAYAEHADGHPDCDLMGGLVDTRTLNDPAGAGGWRQDPPPDRLPDKMGFLPLAIGANLAVRASVFEALGGWNEAYAYGSNDVEFSWRAQIAGHRLCFVPGAVVAFRYRSSLRQLAWQMYRRGLSEPQLYRDFRPRGLPRRPLWRMVGGVARLLVCAPDLLRGSARRGYWVNRAVTVVGRARGSVRHRTLYV